MAKATTHRVSPPRTLILIALALLVWLVEAALPVHAQRWTEQEGRWEFTGQMVMRPLQVEHWMEQGFSRQRAQELYAEATAYTVRTLGEHVYRYFERMDEYWFNLPQGRTENDLGEELIATGYYRSVCPNWKTYPCSTGKTESLLNECPDDEFLDNQWHLKRIEACAAWQIHHEGDDDFVIAVLDAGLRTSHEDFSTLNEYRREGYNIGEELWESQNGTIYNTLYHGNIVTGAAAATGNNGVGTSGIGWSLRHRSIVVDGTMYETLLGLWFAAETAGDRIIVSTASISDDPDVQQVWRDQTEEILASYDVLIFQAGQNDTALDFEYEAFPDMIVVGGTDQSDERWIQYGTYGSTVGPHLDVMAPATHIYGPDWEDDDGYRDSLISGTSYATPQAAGLCALIWSYDPSLSGDEVRDLLYAGCDAFTGYQSDRHGHGRISAFNSLALASGSLWTRDPAPGEAEVSNKFKAAGAADGATVRFNYGASTGQTAVSGCTNVNVDIANASILGTATAGSNGAAILSATVPSGWAGQTRYLQVVDLSDCRVSNLIEFTFPN